MWIITHIDPTWTAYTHTNIQAQLEGIGYRQFIYTRLFPSLSTGHTHSRTHLHTHTDISKEAEWNVSVYLCERRWVINQVCVSASDQSHSLTVTNWFNAVAFSLTHRRTGSLAIQHTHAWFPSDCQANFMQTFEMSHKIRRKLSDFPSTGMKMNISGGKNLILSRLD